METKFLSHFFSWTCAKLYHFARKGISKVAFCFCVLPVQRWYKNRGVPRVREQNAYINTTFCWLVCFKNKIGFSFQEVIKTSCPSAVITKEVCGRVTGNAWCGDYQKKKKIVHLRNIWKEYIHDSSWNSKFSPSNCRVQLGQLTWKHEVGSSSDQKQSTKQALILNIPLPVNFLQL